MIEINLYDEERLRPRGESLFFVRIVSSVCLFDDASCAVVVEQAWCLRMMTSMGTFLTAGRLWFAYRLATSVPGSKTLEMERFYNMMKINILRICRRWIGLILAFLPVKALS